MLSGSMFKTFLITKIKENIIEGSNFHNEFCELCSEYTNGD